MITTIALPKTREETFALNGAKPATPKESQPQEDRFPYGWRLKWITLPDGKIDYEYIPLTQQDFLNPQIGDQMVQSDRHHLLVDSVFGRYYNRYVDDPTTGVFSDLKMLWGIPGLEEPAPDLAVVPNLQTKGEHHSSLNVVTEGTRPCLIVEVVSPNYPGDDTKKVAIYERAGIAEYIIVDPHYEDDSKPFELTGYRLVDGKYRPMPPDKDGYLVSETTGVRLGLDASRRALILVDALSGETLLTREEERAERLEAQRLVRLARRRARQARRRTQEAELTAALAEQRAAQETARADEAATRANEAVTRADEAVTRADEAVTRADEATAHANQEATRAEQERLARLDAEARAAAAEAELARLRALFLNRNTNP